MHRRRPSHAVAAKDLNRRHGRLAADELAEAVVLADLSLMLTIVGQFVPLGTVLIAAAVVPMAVLAARHRLRAVLVGALASATVGFLVVGTAAVTAMAFCAVFGALVGAAERRGWGRIRTWATGIGILWPLLTAAAEIALLVLPNLRKLVLDQVRNSWQGFARILRWFGLDRVAKIIEPAVNWSVRYWWITVAIGMFVAVVFAIWIARSLARPTLYRMRQAFGTEASGREVLSADDGDRAPAPLPVALRAVSYRYPGSDRDALQNVSIEVNDRELLAVVGPNGSGKSTLARLVVGRLQPTTGAITRPGAVGLGHAGGAAIVFQHPEAQVLGVRVRDDVVWGLPPDHHVDVEAVLDRVALRELANRETGTLSGGELQRLALAAAIARSPRLLVSDESTAMIDPEGRELFMTLLRRLAADDGMGVVHVSHRPGDAAVADATFNLGAARTASAPGRGRRVAGVPRSPVIVLDGVGYVYSRATPWAHRALEAVDLTIHNGESVLVVGHNGSGKSTLAWIIAGLLAPTEGEALLDGEPLYNQVGRVGLAFQHARLQLLRPTVENEVRSASGATSEDTRRALLAVGLEPRTFADRRIDVLSGGQLRRVVLAGVLAGRPRALVLDEPFAGLDEDGRAELTSLLGAVRASREIALVIVSHDRDLRDGVIDRVVELEDGRITRDQPVDAAATNAAATRDVTDETPA